MSGLDLSNKRQPHVLTIAGSDSGGGAGIQADLKTIAAHGCYGSSVVTALTAQNTLGVQAVHEVPADFVVKQLESIMTDDLVPEAIKFGMLSSAPIISALASYLSSLPQRPFLILDPVMISTSGHTLLPTAAIEALRTLLLPLVDVVTPNIPEAQALAGSAKPSSLADVVAIASSLRSTTGAKAVLLKGGHMPVSRAEAQAAAGAATAVYWADGDDEQDTVEVLADFRAAAKAERSGLVVVDVLVDDAGVRLFVGSQVQSTSTHGTGCTLSAALASCYTLQIQAGRHALSDAAVKRAIEYTQGAIASAYPLGLGHGPLNHYHLTQPRALPPPTAHNPHPFTSHLIRSTMPLWKSYVRHPFVVQLGQGTLPRAAFEHYIKQDYHYLRHYARAHGLGAYKSEQFDDIQAFAEIALHIARESQMHVAYCAEFGISLADLHATPEAAASAAYSRFILDVGTQGDVLDLYVALASCLIGYGEVGLWLKKRVATGEATLDGNLYARWMGDYAGDDFLAAVTRGIENLERRVARDPPTPARLARLEGIWRECVRLERDFWQMGMDQSW